MTELHFYWLLFGGITSVLISLNKIKPLSIWVKPLSSGIRRLIGFLGWNLIFFAFYDHFLMMPLIS